MKRLKIYLDTSVISHLDAADRPDWMVDTQKLWKIIQGGKYEVFISPVVMGELAGCKQPKYETLLKWLRSIQCTELQETDEVLELASQYLEARVLKEDSYRDCQHIDYACVNNCDMVVSWNFKHLVNVDTIAGVKSVNALAGYKEMPIYSPQMLVKGGVDDDT